MPEPIPTVPSGMPAATPAERVSFALARSRNISSLAPRRADDIARAKHVIGTETARVRERIERLAWSVDAETGTGDLADAVGHLSALLARMAELNAMDPRS